MALWFRNNGQRIEVYDLFTKELLFSLTTRRQAAISYFLDEKQLFMACRLKLFCLNFFLKIFLKIFDVNLKMSNLFENLVLKSDKNKFEFIKSRLMRSAGYCDQIANVSPRIRTV